MSNIVLSLLVDNQAGVLSRIAGLFSRRGYNIDSLTVGETADPNLSRMTIVSSGEPEVLEQIQKQLRKLIDVKEIKVLPNDKSVCRELILIRVEASAEERPQVISLAEIFRARVVDVSDHSLMMEITGNQAKLEAFIRLLSKFKVVELARTGVTGMSRGSYED